MKLIIAGSRHLHISSKEIAIILSEKLGCWSKIEEVVSGGASGIDKSGEDFAHEFNKKLIIFPADWSKHGKKAGPIRNAEMAEYGDALLLIWDGQSRGSKSMRSQMLARNKPIYEVIIKET